jgi:uncharacterized protein
MRTRPKVEDTVPWYRQFWPWFLIAIPSMSVVGGVITAILALSEPQSMVVDDYARIGLATHRRLERDDRATALGLGGELALIGDPPEIRVRLNAGQSLAWPDLLRLTLAHPTMGERDLKLELVRDGDDWRGSLPRPLESRRYVQIEPPSGDWRLAGELAAGQHRLVLNALPPAE